MNRAYNWQTFIVLRRRQLRWVILALVVLLVRLPNAFAVDTTWTLNGDGNWNVPANWSNGEPTNGTFDVFIDDGDSAVTVQLNVNRGIGNLTVGANDTLRLSDTFDLSITGATVANNGVIAVIAGDVLNFNTDILLNSSTVTFTGTGTLQLGGTFQSRILNTTTTNELVNGSTHTIAGGGQFGVNSMKLTNLGTVDANIAGTALIVDPSSSNAVNTGTMRASSGGVLRLQGGVFTNTGGTIRAQGVGSVVELSGAANGLTIVGGTLSTDDDGLLQITAGTPILQDLSIDGTLRVGNDLGIELRGTIDNRSTIKLDGTGNLVDIQVENEVHLTGGGEIQMIGLFSRILDEFGATEGHLVNEDNYIHGRGSIGADGGRMLVTNGGVIEADAGAVAGPLSIRGRSGAVGHVGVVNTGVLRASNNSTLNLSGTGGGAFKNEGTIESVGDGSVVITNNSAVIGSLVGGVLTEGTYRVVSADGNINLTTILFNAPNGVINEIGAAATVELSGDASRTSFTSGTQQLKQSLVTNNGTLKLFNGQNFAMTNALVNNGTVELGGNGLADGVLNSAGDVTNGGTGTIRGHGTVNNTILNSGTVAASGGTLAIVGGIIDGQSGTIRVDAGSTLNLSGTSGDSDTDSLVHQGAGLALGTRNILVRADYVNDNSGVGNAYNARANVTGTGQILASPGVTQTLGGNVANGGATTATMAFGNIHVGDSPTRNYQINNTGAGGPSLRGAIQTSVGGANLTDPRLGGAGATAGNFGPVASGGNSGDLPVTFNATSAGALSNQKVRIVNNFDNVAEQTLEITGAAYRYASPSAHTPEPVDFGIVHVGDVLSQTLSISNTAANDGFSERLDASIGSPTGNATTNGGTISALTPGSTNNTSLAVGIGTATAGAKTGTATISLVSNGADTSGLANTNLPPQTVNISAQVNNFAAANVTKKAGSGNLTPSGPNQFTLNLGFVGVGGTDLQAELAVANTAAAPSDSLAGSFALAAPAFSLSGFDAFTGVAAGADHDGLLVGLDSATVGDFTGTITLQPRSTNPRPFTMDLAPITIHLIGEVRLTGDYNDDGKVDAADYTVWRNRLNTAGPLANETVTIGTVDQQDYAAWKSNFGATATGSGSVSGAFDSGSTGSAGVPEPGTFCLFAFGGLIFVIRFRTAVGQGQELRS